MEYFLLWEIFKMSRVFTTMYAESTILFLAYSHNISNINLLQDVYLA